MRKNELKITGFVLKDSERIGSREAAKFAVAVERNVGKGKEKKTDIFNVSCWTKVYDSVLEHVKKGEMVNVTGSIVFQTSEGKIFPEVYMDSFQLIKLPKKSAVAS